MSLSVLELFAGLGGWRYALTDPASVAAAYDISPPANATYELNHGHRPIAKELASLPAEQLLSHHADTWLMSPPCQPFCRMGNQQGLEDRRSRAFLRLMEIFQAAPPQHLGLENVMEFLGSDAHNLLLERLRHHGFHWLEYQLCPTMFGIPNQRPRVFLLASRRTLTRREPPRTPPETIAPYLDEFADPELYLDSETLAKHKPGLDLVNVNDHRTACFIGGYGQRYVGSGSFLKTDRDIRRFSPCEIARFMGLPRTFHFPDNIGPEQRYKLLGNSLNIPVARWVIRQLEG